MSLYTILGWGAIAVACLAFAGFLVSLAWLAFGRDKGQRASREHRWPTFRTRAQAWMTTHYGAPKPSRWRAFLAWCDRPLHVPAPVAVVHTAPPAGAGTPNVNYKEVRPNEPVEQRCLPATDRSPGLHVDLPALGMSAGVTRRGAEGGEPYVTAPGVPAAAVTVQGRVRAENAPGDARVPRPALDPVHRVDYLAEYIAAAWERVATPMQRQLLWQAHAQPEWDGIEHLQPAWQDATDSFARFVEAGVA